MLGAVTGDAFVVLAEPTRRRILAELREAERSVGELVGSLDVPQPTVSKHLKVLREAGFVSARIAAQQRIYRLEAAPFDGARRLARAVPGGLGAAPRRPGAAPRRTGGQQVNATRSRPRRAGSWSLARDLRHPPAAVWAALTEPDQLAAWAPFTAGRDLGATGEAHPDDDRRRDATGWIWPRP